QRASHDPLYPVFGDGRPGLWLSPVHDPADLRLAGEAGQFAARGCRGLGSAAGRALSPGDSTALAAGGGRGLPPGFHTGAGLVPHVRPPRGRQGAQDRQPGAEPVRRSAELALRLGCFVHPDGAGARRRDYLPTNARHSAGRKVVVTRRLPRWLIGLVLAVYLFLHLPILVLVAFSFNASKFSVEWTGFSLEWYRRLLERDDILHGLRASLIVGLVATVIATLLGTLIALGIARHRFRGRRVLEALIYVPIVTPEIVT